MDDSLVCVPAEGFVSFANVPVETDLALLEADVAFLGVPWGIPYAMDQCRSAGAPDYIRGLSSRFVNSVRGNWCFDFDGRLFDDRDVRLVDCGNVRGDPMDMRGTVERATEAVKAILSRGAAPIVFGGDDAIPIPVARAYKEFGPIVVVQVDEHLDFRDESRGVREGYSSPMRRISEMEWVEKVVQIGLHGTGGSADATQRDVAVAAGHILVTEREVHEKGMGAVLERIPKGANYFITIDFDGLDPAVCPAVSHPEPGGLTFHEAVDLLRGLATRGRVVGMDLAEMVPDHDLHGLGGRTAGRLVMNLIAAMARAGQFERG